MSSGFSSFYIVSRDQKRRSPKGDQRWSSPRPESDQGAKSSDLNESSTIASEGIKPTEDMKRPSVSTMPVFMTDDRETKKTKMVMACQVSFFST